VFFYAYRTIDLSIIETGNSENYRFIDIEPSNKNYRTIDFDPRKKYRVPTSEYPIVQH
jgi:hypothetical protein